MDKVVVYLHGQGGSADEAAHFRHIFADCDVIGFDYASTTPWEAKDEFLAYFEALATRYKTVWIIANSLGAYFAMCALGERHVQKAFFISPVVDMEKLTYDMMRWANVSEDDLRKQGVVETTFGQTLSWAYLCYVRKHPVTWHVPTRLLYGGKDELISLATVTDFAARTGASLTVMENGEHWFHTEEQMRFLDGWLKSED